MKEMGLSRPKVDVARVAETDLWTRLTLVATTGAMPREWPSGQVDHHCRGTARVTVTCPVDDVHQARLTGA